MQTELIKKEREQAWRVDLRKKLKNKERLEIERSQMPQVSPKERILSQNVEVNSGLDELSARLEASRCMDCANPTCIDGCPVSISIPTFIKNIERGHFLDAAAVLKQTSALPAVCGRVCPQEKQCEAHCFYPLKLKKPAVAIGYLERFAADYERTSGKAAVPECLPLNGHKVAAIGSGPASLSFAGDMIKRGYEVTVFEALHEIGGVLKYGIPEFRLPNAVVEAELKQLQQSGVQFERNFIVGKTASFDDLRQEGFEAFFVASGAGLPRFMGIPGENLNGILSSNEYLTRVNLMHAFETQYDTPVLRGKCVAVVGGGNTAIDSVRTAKRLGAERAMIIYRRSREEMPAREEELNHAAEEGVEFINLANPVAYFPDSKGRVNRMQVQRMKLGEPDDSGRRRPEPIEGALEQIDVDVVVVAIGVSPNPLIPHEVNGLKVSRWGTIEVDPESMQSSVADIFAGGDIVRGGATVILAMGDGRRAAAGMHIYLQKVTADVQQMIHH